METVLGERGRGWRSRGAAINLTGWERGRFPSSVLINCVCVLLKKISEAKHAWTVIRIRET